MFYTIRSAAVVRAIYQHLSKTAIDTETRMKPYAIFCMTAFPLYYLANIYIIGSITYDNIISRILIVLFSLILLLKDYWPKKARIFLPLYWYFALTYSFPFFISFMMFKNNASTAWVLNFLSVTLLLALLVDWISYIFIWSIGVLAGMLAYNLTTTVSFTYVPGTVEISDIVNTFFISLVMVTVFSYKREKMEEEKLQAMMAVGASIAHELRTPLLAIDSGLTGIEKYFDRLLETYEIAKHAGLSIPSIRAKDYEQLANVIDEVTAEIDYSNTIIDMLLHKIRQNISATTANERCQINDCIDEALRRYPFADPEQQQLVHWDIDGDFTFEGDKLLIIHVIFNLLKNALHFIAEARKGEIFIWVDTETSTVNKLHFKDTAKGMSPEAKLRLFERFFTSTRHGTGLGLPFCKMVMQNLGGDISCNSVEGEYTEFIVHFQKIKVDI